MQTTWMPVQTLPMVVPCCFTTVLKAPIPFAVLAGLSRRSQTGEAVFAFAFPLIDVTVMPDDEIRRRRRMALLESFENVFVTRPDGAGKQNGSFE
ncbi:Rpn family recombination-promoting nuclease/putative transposase [Shigella boydii]